ncbi:DUF6082 family protein [Actinoplanes sp. NPDC089786]|uniref:DUF6082 family protein n=1 Tax=Actinoplanes sp. NPDC089786 TaxID=3155185 RepID=UPI00343DA1A1
MTAAAAVVWAPVFLAQFARAPLPWSQLADIGDAYGGASALLSAAALCGIGVSLIYQQKQLRQELTGIDRHRHHDLIKIALDHPEFLQILEPEMAASPTGRLEVYANLGMHYWLAAWELGEVDDDELRALAAMMFKNPVAREWWRRSGTSWIGTQTRRGRQRFIDLVSQEQLKASHAAPGRAPVVAPPPPAVAGPRTRRRILHGSSGRQPPTVNSAMAPERMTRPVVTEALRSPALPAQHPPGRQEASVPPGPSPASARTPGVGDDCSRGVRGTCRLLAELPGTVIAPAAGHGQKLFSAYRAEWLAHGRLLLGRDADHLLLW